VQVVQAAQASLEKTEEAERENRGRKAGGKQRGKQRESREVKRSRETRGITESRVTRHVVPVQLSSVQSMGQTTSPHPV
jgi:hypothetical protein